MLWLAPLLLAVGAVADCDDLSGEWRNAKGSVLKIQQDRHQLHGTFTTTVEVKEGSAGNGAAHIRGWADDGILTFGVRYDSSVVAFTGQCYEKNGKDTIQTTWLLHAKQNSCDDHWLSTRVGQDKFVRAKTRGQRMFSNEDM